PGDGSEMPPPESFRLTRELVAERAEDNVVVITFGNFAFVDFMVNWAEHLMRLGVTNFLVGAMDAKALEALYRRGVPVFDMNCNTSSEDVGWGSARFHMIGREKVFLINRLLRFDFEILVCDADMIWLKNPLPYLARYPEADVLTSSDQVAPTVGDDQLERFETVGTYNIGIFHWRPTESSRKLAKEWMDLLISDEQIWDQNGFNDLVRKKLGPRVDDEDGSGVFYAYDGKLKLGLLPSSIFCSGHTYFVQAMYQQLGLEPYAVHTTFQYAGTEGKRHRLREAMAFYDPPEYYDAPGGFLTFRANIPTNVLFEGKHDVETHFRLVNYQIKQIRTALAIASLLNRTLVIPPLWCRLDRMWYGHPGILIGSLTRQPFICPLDHVFNVDMMVKVLPEVEFGPQIGIREYSFLDNPALPQQAIAYFTTVKYSWLDVTLCNPKSKGCEVTTTNSTALIKFPRESAEETFMAVFSAFKDVKVIRFSSMQRAFSRFNDETREELFRKRVKRYLGAWCCLENKALGHIFYDMYWDEKPNWKPVPPKTKAEDHPPF
ncbi:hypothetical protein M569_06419, partial [Genlisea aurea]